MEGGPDRERVQVGGLFDRMLVDEPGEGAGEEACGGGDAAGEVHQRGAVPGDGEAGWVPEPVVAGLGGERFEGDIERAAEYCGEAEDPETVIGGFSPGFEDEAGDSPGIDEDGDPDQWGGGGQGVTEAGSEHFGEDDGAEGECGGGRDPEEDGSCDEKEGGGCGHVLGWEPACETEEGGGGGGDPEGWCEEAGFVSGSQAEAVPDGCGGSEQEEGGEGGVVQASGWRLNLQGLVIGRHGTGGEPTRRGIPGGTG